jgi:chemotaxis protein MotB
MIRPRTYNISVRRVKKIIQVQPHAGTWKIAYADFMTAMMAFFLLLWLISVTTPAQKKGLAEYFTPTIGLKDSMGIGFRGGKKPSVDPGKAIRDTAAPGLVIGQLTQGPIPAPPDTQPKNPDPDAESTSTDKQDTKDENPDEEMFKITEKEINQQLEQDLKAYKNDVVVQNTTEGFRIDMIDDPKKPMFTPDSAVLTDAGKKILDSMANIIVKTANNVTLTGHTASGSGVSDPQYSNWELSSDRAHAVRRFLITTQMQRDRVVKIVGAADRDPMTQQDATSLRNNRVTIILMRGSYFRDPHAAPSARDLISVGDSESKQ